MTATTDEGPPQQLSRTVPLEELSAPVARENGVVKENLRKWGFSHFQAASSFASVTLQDQAYVLVTEQC